MTYEQALKEAKTTEEQEFVEYMYGEMLYGQEVYGR